MSSPLPCVPAVCDEHLDYKDAKLLYRFRKDDGTFPLSKDVKVFLRGQSLYEKYVSPPLAPGHWDCALLAVLAAGALQLGAPAPLPLLLLLCPPCWELLLPEPRHSCRTARAWGWSFIMNSWMLPRAPAHVQDLGSGMWNREVQSECSCHEHIQGPLPALFQPPRVSCFHQLC